MMAIPKKDRTLSKIWIEFYPDRKLSKKRIEHYLKKGIENYPKNRIENYPKKRIENYPSHMARANKLYDAAH